MKAFCTAHQAQTYGAIGFSLFSKNELTNGKIV
jgi:hypothetical protein